MAATAAVGVETPAVTTHSHAPSQDNRAVWTTATRQVAAEPARDLPGEGINPAAVTPRGTARYTPSGLCPSSRVERGAYGMGLTTERAPRADGILDGHANRRS
jgi:hypothetical protein